MRSLAREIVLQYTFSRLFNQNDEGLFDVLSQKLSASDREFASKILSTIDDGKEKYGGELISLSKNFRLERIHYADRCAIILGMAELDAFPDTPTAIIIDEAVNLAAKFSTENSTDFVNGILAGYAKSIGRK